MRIGELSRRTSCNIETIRYYERIGLLPRAERSASSYRSYESGDVRRLTSYGGRANWGFHLPRCGDC